jgi:glycosyltransferase involved in cell wall biosynthesis
MNTVVNIVAWDNGGGLSRDIDIISAALASQGWGVAYSGLPVRTRSRSLLARASRRLRREARRLAAYLGGGTPPFLVNLFLEEIAPAFIPLARVNVLMPNPEWFMESSVPFLPQMDRVFAKTVHAQRAFEAQGCSVRLVGFSGVDRCRGRIAASQPTGALHVAGSSQLKGTEVVLDVWSAHPEWPSLQLIRATVDYDGKPVAWNRRHCPPNVRLAEGKLGEDQLVMLQNAVPIHVLPSESEGFGHTLAEALSVGALVVTTDAPPMNELVLPDRGLLVAVQRSSPLHLGSRHFVDPSDLERGIEQALAMPQRERVRLGEAARSWFKEGEAAFAARLNASLQEVLAQVPRSR